MWFRREPPTLGSVTQICWGVIPSGATNEGTCYSVEKGWNESEGEAGDYREKGGGAGTNPSEGRTGLELLGGNTQESGEKGRETGLF